MPRANVTARRSEGAASALPAVEEGETSPSGTSSGQLVTCGHWLRTSPRRVFRLPVPPCTHVCLLRRSAYRRFFGPYLL